MSIEIDCKLKGLIKDSFLESFPFELDLQNEPYLFGLRRTLKAKPCSCDTVSCVVEVWKFVALRRANENNVRWAWQGVHVWRPRMSDITLKAENSCETNIFRLSGNVSAVMNHGSIWGNICGVFKLWILYKYHAPTSCITGVPKLYITIITVCQNQLETTWGHNSMVERHVQRPWGILYFPSFYLHRLATQKVWWVPGKNSSCVFSNFCYQS